MIEELLIEICRWDVLLILHSADIRYSDKDVVPKSGQ
jgi:hypothetical protein